MSAAATLLIDAGRTGIRTAIWNDGQAHPTGSGPGLPLLAGSDGPKAAARAIAATVPPGLELDTVAAGLTGFFEVPERRAAIAAAIAEQLDARRAVVTSDVVTSHLGALGGDPGVVAAVGTGTVVLGLASDGRWAKVDGWGYLLGDAGSGFDVGRRGLAAALAAFDGRGGSPDLMAAAAARFGAVDALPGLLYGDDNPARLAASFAPDVAAAARAGDAVARAIWAEAATAIVEAVAAAIDRADLRGGDQRISWAGSMLDVVRLLREPVIADLRERFPDARIREPLGGALEGAARLLTPSIHRRLTPVVTTATR